jgi:hypothetical protein
MGRRSRIVDLAELAGAELHRPWYKRVFRALFVNWRSGKPPARGLVMFSGEDAPRDLDDPLSDPNVQARIGETIAKRARGRKP